MNSPPPDSPNPHASSSLYAPFFGLQRDAFSIAPDPHFLFMSEAHREALAHLLYGVAGGGGFVLLTGEIGSGKTTVCRCFLEQIPPRCDVAVIFNPKLSILELLALVCEEFRVSVGHRGGGSSSVKDHVDALNGFLLAAHAAGRNCVLVVDEAQSLSAEVLEQLRLLTNLETAERKLLQIVLIGQPELRTMLARPELEQLAQRVIARYHLPALSEAGTAHYVQHRLAVAGLQGPLPFDAGALRRVHRLSAGVPRRINLLCGRAMLGAYAHGEQRIGNRVVEQAAREVFGADLPRGVQPWRLAATGAAVGALIVGGVVAAGSRAGDAPVPAEVVAFAPRAPDLAQPAASPPDPAPPAAAGPVPTALADEGAAWRALASLWDVPLAGVDPCRDAMRRQLQCFRGTLGLAQVRQIDRPGIVTLRDGSTRRGFAVLVGLGDDSVTLHMQDGVRTVPLAALAAVWQGDFVTLWRAPPGYSDVDDATMPPVLADWLAPRLAARAGEAASGAAAPPRDAVLRAQLQAFQLAQGLKPDGRAGPMTLMMVNRASGVAEPRLVSER